MTWTESGAMKPFSSLEVNLIVLKDVIQKFWALNVRQTCAFLRRKNAKLPFFADFSFVGPFPDLDPVQVWGLDAQFPGRPLFAPHPLSHGD